jgi:hypothetical protein
MLAAPYAARTLKGHFDILRLLAVTHADAAIALERISHTVHAVCGVLATPLSSAEGSIPTTSIRPFRPRCRPLFHQ